MFICSLSEQRSILEHSLGSNEGEKRRREETAQGEKREPLAPAAALSERLPMWKGLAVNPPLRRDSPRGNASQSPAGSPTWKQLRCPSASSSWWLPEGSAPLPSISGERLVCCDRGGFQGLMKSVGLLPWLSINMRAHLFWWTTREEKRNINTNHSTYFYTHIILIRVWS